VLQHPSIGAHGLVPIAIREMQPSKVLPPARIESYWRVPEARQLHVDLVGLRGAGQQPVSESVRRTLQWRTMADQFLSDLDRWHGARELLEADNFYQRGVLLASLFDLAPHTISAPGR